MGIFEEDSSIRVSEVVKLWNSEGFLKPIDNKSLEKIGREFLKELVDRNLILIDKLGLGGNVKYCKIHDLLRDLSLKEAKKQRFYYVMGEDSRCEGASGRCRIVVPRGVWCSLKFSANNNMSHARSFVCRQGSFRKLPNSRLLRTLNTYGYKFSIEDVFRFVNSRYVNMWVERETRIPCSISQLWNLQTLINRSELRLIAPIEIWKMPQLRHVEFKGRLYIPDPPSSKDDEDDIVVMENLHTLKGVYNLELNEEVVKRIPNIKKLSISYNREGQSSGANFIGYLHCLENLYFSSKVLSCPHLQISFPDSLKKLCLTVPMDCEVDEMLQMIGSLPLLRKLKSIGGVFRTRKWETTDGQFLSLKLLELSHCRGLENWMVSESSHFPLLQELLLSGLSDLKEIPSGIGEIPTLKSIRLLDCSESSILSAKKIVDEQEDLYGDQLDLHVTVYVRHEYVEALRSLSGPNFKVS